MEPTAALNCHKSGDFCAYEKRETIVLKTVWGEQLHPASVLQEYPRPQLVRGSYENLNGFWDYAITKTDARPDTWDGRILVPFSPEAEEVLPQPVVMPAIRPVHRAAVRSFAMVFFFMNGFLSVSKIV